MPRNPICPTPKKESEKDKYTNDAEIRIGKQFQVQAKDIPKYVPFESDSSPSYYDSLNICIWKPSDKVGQTEIEPYLKHAVEENGHTVEQALGILFFNDYDINRSNQDVLEYSSEDPIDAWDEDDRMLFEAGFKLNNKSFLKIKDLLPNKKMSELVHYYYTWKKNKTRVDLKSKKYYSNDLSEISEMNSTAKSSDELQDFHIALDGVDTINDIDFFLEGELSNREQDEEMKKLNQYIFKRKQRIQEKKQNIGMKKKIEINLEETKQDGESEEEPNSSEFPATDIYMLCLAFKDYGLNFEKIAKIIKTKTPQQLQNCYEKKEKKVKYKFGTYVKAYNVNQKAKLKNSNADRKIS